MKELQENELGPAMRQFLDERRFGVLATVGQTGWPRQTVMWFLLDGDEILFNTARGRRKPEHLGRDPRVSLMVEDGYRYLCVYGKVREISDRETTQADIRRLAVRYEGEAGADKRMRDVYSKQDRISYRFRIERVAARDL